MNMKEYMEMERKAGRYCGKELLQKATELAKPMLPNVEAVTVASLVSAVYVQNEGFDGEPVSAKWLAEQTVKHVEWRKAKGLPLTASLDF